MMERSNRKMISSFKIGDLVWAKMKGFPAWPGKISAHPTEDKVKKFRHYVFFYGSKNYAWIPDKNIEAHKKVLVLKYTKFQKRSAVFLNAVKEIVTESRNLKCIKKSENSFRKPLKSKFSSKSKYLKKTKKDKGNGPLCNTKIPVHKKNIAVDKVLPVKKSPSKEKNSGPKKGATVRKSAYLNETALNRKSPARKKLLKGKHVIQRKVLVKQEPPEIEDTLVIKRRTPDKNKGKTAVAKRFAATEGKRNVVRRKYPVRKRDISAEEKTPKNRKLGRKRKCCEIEKNPKGRKGPLKKGKYSVETISVKEEAPATVISVKVETLENETASAKELLTESASVEKRDISAEEKAPKVSKPLRKRKCSPRRKKFRRKVPLKKKYSTEITPVEERMFATESTSVKREATEAAVKEETLLSETVRIKEEPKEISAKENSPKVRKPMRKKKSFARKNIGKGKKIMKKGKYSAKIRSVAEKTSGSELTSVEENTLATLTTSVGEKVPVFETACTTERAPSEKNYYKCHKRKISPAKKSKKAPVQKVLSKEKAKNSVENRRVSRSKRSRVNIRKAVPKVKVKQEKAKARKRVAEKTSVKKLLKKEGLKREIVDDDYSELIRHLPPNYTYYSDSIVSFNEQVNVAARNESSSSSSGYNTRNSSMKIIPTQKKIGFLGLGSLGQRIVKILLDTGHCVMIWNRTCSKCDMFERAERSDTPADVVKACDITFSCVSDPEASKELIFGENGVLDGLDGELPESFTRDKKGFVELTSLDPQTSQTISEAITGKGGRYLEAQCSGRRHSSSEEFLLILAAGDSSLFSDCESCFFAIGKNSLHLSEDVGVATKFNIVQSMVLGTMYAALAESLSLVEQIGLQGSVFLDILSESHVNMSEVIKKGPDIIANRSINHLRHMQKNINFALDLGQSVEQSMPVTSAAGDAYTNCKLLSYEENDTDTDTDNESSE